MDNPARACLLAVVGLSFTLGPWIDAVAGSPLDPESAPLRLTLTTAATHSVPIKTAGVPALLVIEEHGLNIERLALDPGLAGQSGDRHALDDEIWASGMQVFLVPARYRGNVSLVASRMDRQASDIELSLIAVAPAWNIQLERLQAAFDPQRGSLERAADLSSLAESLRPYEPHLGAQFSTLSFLALDEARERERAREGALTAAAAWADLTRPHQQAFARAKAARYLMYREISPLIEQELTDTLKLLQHSPNPALVYLTRNYLCLYYMASGQLDRARPCAESNLEVARQSDNPTYRRQSVNNLGGTYLRLGFSGMALKQFQQALEIARDEGLRSVLAGTHNNLGLVLRQRGELEQALREYDQGLRYARELGQHDTAANLLRNIGRAYYWLKDYERSLDFLNQSEALEREYGEPAMLALTRAQIADAQRALGQIDAALSTLREALATAEASGHTRIHAVTLESYGHALLASGRTGDAIDSYTKVVSLQKERGDTRGEAVALVALAEASLRAGTREVALAHYDEAARLAGQLSDPQLRIQASVGRVQSLKDLGRLAQARALALTTLRQVQGVRSELALPEHKAALTGASHRAFELAVELHFNPADPDGNRAALRIAEQARSQALRARLLARNNGALGDDAVVNDLRAELSARLDRRVSLAASESNPRVIETYDRETSELLRRLELTETERLLELGLNPDDREAELDGYLHALGRSDLWVYFFLAEESGYRWTYSRSAGLSAARIPGRRQFAREIRELHSSWSSGRPDLLAAGKAVAARLKLALFDGLLESSDGERLIILPHGPLELIPFAALPLDGSDAPVATRWRVLSQPSPRHGAADTSTDSSRPPAPRRALVFADPVFSAADPRVANVNAPEQADPARWNLLRLGASVRELESIQALLGRDRVQARVGFDAHRQALLDARGRFAVLHLATHGLADDRRPEASGLMLSRVTHAGDPLPGFVGLADIYGLRLQSSLVVLTACETALGSEQLGEGLASVSQAFLHAGSREVIATLWRVADPAAARFSELFYRAHFESGLEAAEALRQAQLQMQRERRWRHPAHWAAFVIRANMI